MKSKLVIKKKALKGEDGYKVFSVRLKDETVERLNDLAQKKQPHAKRVDQHPAGLCNEGMRN